MTIERVCELSAKLSKAPLRRWKEQDWDAYKAYTDAVRNCPGYDAWNEAVRRRLVKEIG